MLHSPPHSASRTHSARATTSRWGGRGAWVGVTDSLADHKRKQDSQRKEAVLRAETPTRSFEEEKNIHPPPPEVGVVDPATNLSTPKKRKLACLGCPCVCLNWGTFFNSCGSQGNRLDKEQEQLWRVGLRMATHENLPPHNSFVLLPSTILKLVHREPQWQQTYSGHLWLL